MRKRIAVKVLMAGLDGYPYRDGTVNRAAARLNSRRKLKLRAKLRRSDAASLTAAFMKRLGSIHAVRFWLDSKQVFDELESLA